MIGARQIAAFQAAHIAELVAARLEPGDFDENSAALSLTSSIAGPNLLITATATGRCNLLSGCTGILVIDPAVVDRVNMVDEAITLATLAPFCRVAEREMTAPVYHRRIKRPSSTGYGEKGFLDLCQSEALDHIQVGDRLKLGGVNLPGFLGSTSTGREQCGHFRMFRS